MTGTPAWGFPNVHCATVILGVELPHNAQLGSPKLFGVSAMTSTAHRRVWNIEK